MRGAVGLVALAVGLLMFTLGSSCGETCPTAEQRTYLKEVEDWTKSAQAANEELIAITKEAAIRRERYLDEEWRLRLKHVLDEIDSVNQEMMSVKVPAGAQEMHRLLVRGLEATFEANELFLQGVLAVDIELMDRSNVRRIESVRLFREVPPISDFCE